MRDSPTVRRTTLRLVQAIGNVRGRDVGEESRGEASSSASSRRSSSSRPASPASLMKAPGARSPRPKAASPLRWPISREGGCAGPAAPAGGSRPRASSHRARRRQRPGPATTRTSAASKAAEALAQPSQIEHEVGILSQCRRRPGAPPPPPPASRRALGAPRPSGRDGSRSRRKKRAPRGRFD